MLELWQDGHFKKKCKEPRKKTWNDSANIVTKEVYDALILSIDTPLDSWVLDSRASLHTTAIREVLENYVVKDYKKGVLG
jgi:hypothetical protein